MSSRLPENYCVKNIWNKARLKKRGILDIVRKYASEWVSPAGNADNVMATQNEKKSYYYYYCYSAICVFFFGAPFL